MKFFIILIFIFYNNNLIYAANNNSSLPKFVSLKFNEVNARTGPNLRYPIKWVYIQKGEPVEIIAQFEQWRKIKDYNGDEGWVHEAMIHNKRHVIVHSKDYIPVYMRDSMKRIIAKAEPKARLDLVNCNNRSCKIKNNNIEGYVMKEHLWGIYNNEAINK